MLMRAGVVALALSLLAQAEEPPEEQTPEAIASELEAFEDLWRGFPNGSWVEVRVVARTEGLETSTIARLTLKSRGESGQRIESRVWQLKDGAKSGDPEVSERVMKFSVRCEDLKEVKKDRIEVGGKAVECRVIEAKVVKTWQEEGEEPGEFVSSMRIWYAKGLGIVKRTGDLGGASSWTHTLVDPEAEVTVAGKKVKCSRCRLETEGSVAEWWLSSEVPGGWARYTLKTSWDEGGKKVETDSTSEVIDFHVPRPGSD